MGRLSSNAAEASHKRQSVLKQEVASLRGQLAVVVPTPSVNVESKLSSIREELAAVDDTIGKLRAKMQKDLDQFDYNLSRDSDQYSWAVDDRQEAKSNHSRKVLASKSHERDLESKLFAVVVGEE